MFGIIGLKLKRNVSATAIKLMNTRHAFGFYDEGSPGFIEIDRYCL